MFHVTGALDAVVYGLAVLDEAPWIEGSPAVVSLLEREVGETFLATPTGPAYTLDLSDQASILACLYRLTMVTETEGPLPDLVPPSLRSSEGLVADA